MIDDFYGFFCYLCVSLLLWYSSVVVMMLLVRLMFSVFFFVMISFMKFSRLCVYSVDVFDVIIDVRFV